MISSDMFAVWAIALLSFMAMSHSAPLECKDVLKPLDQPDLQQLEGTWALVAESMKIIEAQSPLQLSDSTRIDFFNSTYSRALRFGNNCHYDSYNVTVAGHTVKVDAPFNYTGTFHRTSCADCVILNLNLDSPVEKTKELCLFSKRRAVDQKALREFFTQVECLNMPEPTVMDPTTALCPALPRFFFN